MHSTLKNRFETCCYLYGAPVDRVHRPQIGQFTFSLFFFCVFLFGGFSLVIFTNLSFDTSLYTITRQIANLSLEYISQTYNKYYRHEACNHDESKFRRQRTECI
ncbi:unnamed protein product [Penicillium salamii]|nr:unnamed protein product [Penicillium salamii]